MTITPTRLPQGIPVGGQFAAAAHAEPAIALTSRLPAVAVPFLHENHFGSLPPLPATVGTPKVTFDFNVDGKLETHVNVGGSTMTFWHDDMADDITNTIEAGRSGEGEVAPWSSITEYSDWEQTRTWAQAVHERIDCATFQVLSHPGDSRHCGYPTKAQGQDPPLVNISLVHARTDMRLPTFGRQDLLDPLWLVRS